MTLYGIIVGILVMLLIGYLLAIPLALFALIAMFIAAAKAGNGKEYRYPLCIRFIK